MEYFYDLSAREMLSSMDDSKKLCELYEYGLFSHNPLVTICAQNELANRGDLDLIRCSIESFIQKDDKLEDDSFFLNILGKSLVQFKRIDPVLHYIGRNMLHLNINTNLKDPISQSVEDEAALISVMKELIEKYDYCERDFFELCQEVLD